MAACGQKRFVQTRIIRLLTEVTPATSLVAEAAGALHSQVRAAQKSLLNRKLHSFAHALLRYTALETPKLFL
jgi:hypothetical protein